MIATSTNASPAQAAMFALAMLLVAGSGMARAQTATEGAAQSQPAPQAWTVNCSSQGASGDLVCTMGQVLVVQETGQRVIAVGISRAPDGIGHVARFSLPHGILLVEGIETWIDEGPRGTHQITTADQHGSYAVVPLGDTMIAAMRIGRVLNVSVTAGSGEKVTFPLSLMGFTAAFARI